MTIGEKISRLRKETNYTQEQLADILGVSRQAISKWESNVTYPETDKLIRLSKLFNCSLDYLLKESEESNRENPSQEESLSFRKRLRERKVKKQFGECPCGISAGTQKAFLPWESLPVA